MDNIAEWLVELLLASSKAWLKMGIYTSCKYLPMTSLLESDTCFEVVCVQISENWLQFINKLKTMSGLIQLCISAHFISAWMKHQMCCCLCSEFQRNNSQTNWKQQILNAVFHIWNCHLCLNLKHWMYFEVIIKKCFKQNEKEVFRTTLFLFLYTSHDKGSPSTSLAPEILLK